MDTAVVKSELPASAPPPVIAVAVRELVEFVLRRGDLAGRGEFSAPGRALAGTRGHQRVQRARPAGYEPEVLIAETVAGEGFELRISGRMDGVWVTGDGVVVEEIKTVMGKGAAPVKARGKRKREGDGSLALFSASESAGAAGGAASGPGRAGDALVPDALHWAQAKMYAAMLARQRGLSTVGVLLSYLDLTTEAVTEFRETFSAVELRALFEAVAGEYLVWAQRQWVWWRTRDASIATLEFPHRGFRPGQRELAVAVYRTIRDGGRLFASAPTGIGKTISVLFPAAKALGEGRVEKIFYLTAKTVGRAVAEQALADLRAKGLRLRAVTLTARDKVCVSDGRPCDVKTCPRAVGYHDRVKPALVAALDREALDREALAGIAAQHQVCAFALALDASRWADVIIGDYNHVFDPSAYLREHFGGEGREFLFLIDEAHNLIDRAREMFSAEMTLAEIVAVRRAVKTALPACGRALGALQRAFAAPLLPAGAEPAASGELVSHAAPGDWVPLVARLQQEAERWLAQNEPTPWREALTQLYFRANAFVRTVAGFDERFVTIFTPGADARLRLFCLDPSRLIAEALERGRAAVFFSATLTPLEFFRDSLGGEAGDRLVQLASPFPPENLVVRVETGIATDFKQRESTYDAVVAALQQFVGERAGNYLVYFPSYKYLAAVTERWREGEPAVRLLVQTSGMGEAERAAFLAQFQADNAGTLVGCAVLGGVFGEGIDLVGERLIGVAVVGVGLPQVCLERELIRQFYATRGGRGFEFAYQFPGMNRVLQAAGRVIRSETDRGAVLLIDARFAQRRYRELMPTWWRGDGESD